MKLIVTRYRWTWIGVADAIKEYANESAPSFAWQGRLLTFAKEIREAVETDSRQSVTLEFEYAEISWLRQSIKTIPQDI